MKKVILLFTLLMTLLPSTVFAQRSTKKAETNYTLTINCNVPSYRIWIDNAQVKGKVRVVSAGMHTITVRAEGYSDWTQTINVTGNQTLNVNMTGNQYRLSINANSNSVIYLNNNLVGNHRYSALMNPGTYSVLVKTKGFQDYNETIILNRDTNVNVNLAPMQHRLSIQTNTASSIYINNRMVGNNSYNGSLDPGTYSVVVRSNGFMDYRATVVLDRDTNLVANLQPLTASVSVFIPPELLNDRIGGAINQVKIFDNGKMLKGYNFQLPPGNHTIRIETGGFAIEGNYNFEAGRTYNIEPVMYMNIK